MPGGRRGAVLAPPWGAEGLCNAVLGASEGRRPSWGCLGCLVGHRGVPLGHLGALFGGPLGRLGATFGAS
eukprot:9477775-Pyramimonas_sp.AAC.1